MHKLLYLVGKKFGRFQFQADPRQQKLKFLISTNYNNLCSNEKPFLSFPKYPSVEYRNTPLKLPWATISIPPGPDGKRTPYGLLRVVHELMGKQPRGYLWEKSNGQLVGYYATKGGLLIVVHCNLSVVLR